MFYIERRAILWSNFMVPFNGAILWHVCTRLNMYKHGSDISITITEIHN